MRVIITIFLLIALESQAQYTTKNLTLETNASRYKFGKLQLYPIRGNKTFLEHNKQSASYKPLKDALTENKLKVTELGSGDVNKLYMENISKDTIVILSGEVIQGGKQDRMLANDVILYPKSKKQVDVFCVEHGRWTADRGNMNFDSYFSISSKEVRKAGTVQKNQGDVWNEVARTTTKNKAESQTGTLAALKTSGQFATELKTYTDYYARLVSNEPDVIGVIAVTGNEVMGCDMFASHELFAKHYINLVNSYASEAITNGKPVNITQQKVQAYLTDLIADESRQESKVNDKGTMLKNGDKKIHLSTFD